MPGPCQSCAMPLMKPEDYGTESSGSRSNDYCQHCYSNGAFTDPSMTQVQMAAKLVTMADKMHMAPAQAEHFGREILPRLKRWAK